MLYIDKTLSEYPYKMHIVQKRLIKLVAWQLVWIMAVTWPSIGDYEIGACVASSGSLSRWVAVSYIASCDHI